MTRLLLSLFILCWLVGSTIVCLASGPMKVTFDQTADCAFIGGWTIQYEPASLNDTTPGATATGISVANAAPLTCGAGIVTPQQFTGVGKYRIWVQAIATDGVTKSAVSNSLDVALPFAAPVLKAVAP